VSDLDRSMNISLWSRSLTARSQKGRTRLKIRKMVSWESKFYPEGGLYSGDRAVSYVRQPFDTV